MRRREAAALIGQRRYWMAGYPPQRQAVTCTHVKGNILMNADGSVEVNFNRVYCSYAHPSAPADAPLGEVCFEAAKFERMERVT